MHIILTARILKLLAKSWVTFGIAFDAVASGGLSSIWDRHPKEACLPALFAKVALIVSSPLLGRLKEAGTELIVVLPGQAAVPP